MARCFISGVRRGSFQSSRNPARRVAIQTSASCATPETGTVQIKTCAIGPPSTAANPIAVMTKILSSTGAAAAAAK